MYFKRILFVASSGKEHLELKSYFNMFGLVTPSVSCFSGSEARRMMLEETFDLIVIKTPLQDETGEMFASMATKDNNVSVLFIANKPQVPRMIEKLSPLGVIVVSSPVDKTLFYQSLAMAFSINRRILGITSENTKLRSRLENIKLINKAKCLLIEHLEYSEDQAHKYIEKSAMDRRMSKAAISNEIIDKINKNLED